MVYLQLTKTMKLIRKIFDNKLLLLIICAGLFALKSTHGQTLHGLVLDSATNAPLKYVIVENKETGQLAYSALNGTFEINCRESELLSFSAVGYRQVLLKAGNQFQVTVRMARETTLTINGETLPALSPYQQDSIERYQTYHNALEHQKDKARVILAPAALVISNPISSWMQYIAPQTRQILRFQKRFARWEQDAYSASRYTISLVQNLTGLPADSAALFMGAYPIANDYAAVASDTEIKMWIMHNYKLWMQRKGRK